MPVECDVIVPLVWVPVPVTQAAPDALRGRARAK